MIGIPFGPKHGNTRFRQTQVLPTTTESRQHRQGVAETTTQHCCRRPTTSPSRRQRRQLDNVIGASRQRRHVVVECDHSTTSSARGVDYEATGANLNTTGPQQLCLNAKTNEKFTSPQPCHTQNHKALLWLTTYTERTTLLDRVDNNSALACCGWLASLSASWLCG